MREAEGFCVFCPYLALSVVFPESLSRNSQVEYSLDTSLNEGTIE